MRKKGIHFENLGIGKWIMLDSLAHWIFVVGDNIGDHVNEFPGSVKCGAFLD